MVARTPSRALLTALALLVALPITDATAGGRDDPTRGVPRNVVEGDLRDYPTTSFVVGVGFGADREEARARAVQSIAQQVSARIRTTVGIDDSYATTRNGRDRNSVEVSTYASEAEITSAFDQSDLVRVVETHMGKNKTWVVAVLDRGKAASTAQARFSKIKADFESKLGSWKEKGSLPPLARQELEELRQRAEREWSMLGAFTGDAGGFPDIFRGLDHLAADSATTTLSFCIGADGRAAVDYELVQTLLVLAQMNGNGWEVCDRNNDRVPILNGLLKADPRPSPTSSGDWLCSTDLEFRMVMPGGADGGAGRTGGGSTRAVAESAYDACVGATQLLVPFLEKKLSEM